MVFTKSVAQRAVVAAAGAAMAVMAIALPTSGQALADPPNCTPADLAGVASGVAASASAYLFTHPDVNDFYGSLKGKSQDEVAKDVRAFFDANPQAHNELRAIRQPMTDFRDRCGLAQPDRPLLGE
ncbi:hemophore-related protein [Mycobacterium sp. CBMA293]|uniref:heme-binding protein n=1 Tax=unclassified Mycolicibacterium TaxID=2636767 RepID=UPI0012DD54FD|nr:MULTISPECIES: heme-binding protein [unclassified Mycolicibacterium]MUL49858.1 hemophore-related protein [Mycolicibacterium sp. CBMA 360]MUL61508.1 hemophore-related protein [Mycolicibacterium sp. CBMA 335]MUL74243.1 hemophore-related protein [Mycolicibacterium sp. CBMA 311]MUL97131.1 hemophore-related protein [Mycolicibacterium sp. CBMA 230]MUM08193.1 hemophore-related protein [Mycolicibacterium sp. CBMA 213]